MGFVQQPLSNSIYTIGDDLDEEEKEKDFQRVALDDEHWIAEPVPDRHLCIHEHSQPPSLCSYPCLYSLDPVSYNSDYAPASYHETLDHMIHCHNTFYNIYLLVT